MLEDSREGGHCQIRCGLTLLRKVIHYNDMPQMVAIDESGSNLVALQDPSGLGNRLRHL
jgi:hypothetical protein